MQRYLRPTQAAEYSGIPVSTLAKRRLRGQDPQYIKIGSAVFYDRQDLDALMASSIRRSTSEAGGPAA